MVTVTKYLMAFSLIVSSSSAMSHAGHDHSSWEAPLMHALFYGSIVFAVGTATYFGLKKKKTNVKQDKAGE